jgi:hypothetical protein
MPEGTVADTNQQITQFTKFGEWSKSNKISTSHHASVEVFLLEEKISSHSNA